MSFTKSPLYSCIEILKDGGLAVIPTDTVYGVVCRAADQNAVKRLYGLKSRASKPGTIIASSIDQLVELGIKRRYLTAVSQFWPNPISIEIPHDIGYLSQSTGRQAFRVVKNKDLQNILDQTGPLLTSSANLPNQPHAKNTADAKRYFGDKIDFYLDGGEKTEEKPSTLIRIVDDAVEILREGSIKVNEKGEIEE